MREVKLSLKGARTHRHINTALLFVIILMLGVGLWIGTLNKLSLNVMRELSSRNTQAIAEVKANQDLNRQQYLDYIKDMIDSMNKLQRDNPNIKVPKAPVPRALQGKVNEYDLRRMPQPAPEPTPIVKTKTIVKYRKPRPTPTPKAWYKYFDQTR